MQFQVKGDGQGFEIRLQLSWRSMRDFIKALVPVIAAFAGFIAAPELARLIALLGW